MQSNNQMRFAMAIHMLQKSNPATRLGPEGTHTTTRRHLGRGDQSADRQSADRQSAATTQSR